ncbi:MAG: hypothetical protein LBU69_00090 [Deltaproteobacteria bacterium]|nr:hypothetical protein [Deltaproteobacteria bacterium]
MLEAAASQAPPAGIIDNLLSKAAKKTTRDIIDRKCHDMLKHKANEINDFGLAIHAGSDRVKALLGQAGNRLSKQNRLRHSHRGCPNNGFGRE